MKKTIKGREYDTEKAQFIGQYKYRNGDPSTWYTEELYKKRNGEYFFAGSGNTNSAYFIKPIVPTTWENAKNWINKHCDKETIAKMVGDGRPGVTISARISAAANDNLERLAGDYRTTKKEVLNGILERLDCEEIIFIRNAHREAYEKTKQNTSSKA